MTATVSAKGQLVIPAGIRKRYHLSPKSKVEVFDTGHSIIIRPVGKDDPFLASRGILKGKVSTKDLLAMRRQERAREAR
jgi:AbrB family looped-hinge helix DNA binding protein